MRRSLLILSALITGLMPSISQATSTDIETYELESPHTQIIFFANHLGFSNSQGKFLDYDGTIIFNRGEPEKSSAEVIIKTASIEMNDEKWNDHMKNEDFFNVEKYPNMTFKSSDIEITGEDTAEITGELTILDTTKPVILDVVFNKAGKHAFSGKYVAGFSATTAIKRSDWGMTYGLPMIGDEIEIRIEVEAIREERGGEGTGNQ